jgi:hypothetical protein
MPGFQWEWFFGRYFAPLPQYNFSTFGLDSVGAPLSISQEIHGS